MVTNLDRDMRLAQTILLSLGLVAGAPAAAQDFQLPRDPEAARFVTSTFIATFYHEYGHALVHVLDLPVLGREEDAVDSLSNLLLHHLHDSDSADDIIWDNALSWSLMDAYEEREQLDWDFAGPHSLTPQRFEQFLCELVGADPEGRQDLAEAAEYDADRIAECADQFVEIDYSWSKVLEGAEPTPRSRGLRLVDTDPESDLAQILLAEIAILNDVIGVPVWIDVAVEECGEFNAFYIPDETRIVMCQEWAAGMLDLWDARDSLLE